MNLLDRGPLIQLGCLLKYTSKKNDTIEIKNEGITRLLNQQKQLIVKCWDQLYFFNVYQTKNAQNQNRGLHQNEIVIT